MFEVSIHGRDEELGSVAPVRMPNSVSIPIRGPINLRLSHSHGTFILLLQRLQIMMSLAQHPDRERELEIGIGNRARLVEYTLNSFLRPGAILRHSI